MRRHGKSHEGSIAGRALTNPAALTTTSISYVPLAPNTTGSGLVAPDRHILGGNYLFADGHVKFLRSTLSQGFPAVYTNDLDYNADGKVGTFTTLD